MFTDFRFELAGTRHQKFLAEAAEQRRARPEPVTAQAAATSAPSPVVGRIVRRFAGPIGL
jgi:hypothetical protein